MVFPRQWAVAGRESPQLFTPITGATILQTLRSPWLTGVGPSGLYVMRWTQDGKPWTGLLGTVVANTAPDACNWLLYFSVAAVPDDAPAGLGTSLLTAWSSWRNSYQRVNGLRRRGASSSSVARAAQAQAQGDLLPEVRRGGVPRFSPRFVRRRQPNLAAVVGR